MNRTMMTLAAAALALPTIASAEPKADPDAAAATSPARTRTVRYCVVETPTGSRIEHRTCKSLDAWLAEGFDPRATK